MPSDFRVLPEHFSNLCREGPSLYEWMYASHLCWRRCNSDRSLFQRNLEQRPLALLSKKHRHFLRWNSDKPIWDRHNFHCSSANICRCYSVTVLLSLLQCNVLSMFQSRCYIVSVVTVTVSLLYRIFVAVLMSLFHSLTAVTASLFQRCIWHCYSVDVLAFYMSLLQCHCSSVFLCHCYIVTVLAWYL